MSPAISLTSLSAKQRLFLGPALLLSIAGIFWVDVETGPEYGLSLLYLTPVGIGAWVYRRRFGVLLATSAAAAWLAADFLGHAGLDPKVWLWNGGTRLFIYLGLAVAVALIRTDRERLQEMVERETQLARTDGLTGLANARAFREQLERDLARANRTQLPICVLYFDIDNFKRINDAHGHAAGDRVLSEIGEAIRNSLRAGDHAARLGGDEFAALHPRKLRDWKRPAD